MLSLILLKKISSLLLIMGVGFAAVRLKLFSSEDSSVLSKLCLYVISPCMIFNTFQVERNQEIIFNLGITLIMAAIVHFSFIGITMLIRKPLKLNVVEQTSIEYTNAGNMVIPLVVAMFGNEMVVYTLAYICVTLVLHWTHLYSMMRPGYKQGIRGLVTNINLVCLIISFVLFLLNIQFPYVIKESLQSITDMIGPVSMLITGMLLGGQDLKRIFGKRRAYFIAFLRLVVLPVISLVFFKAINLDFLSGEGQIAMMICFLAGTSCSASNVVSMSKLFGQDSEYASSINVITLIFSIITMPLLILLYQNI